MIPARIFKPGRSAMQSGKGNSKDWVLQFEPTTAPVVEPLMGWTATMDTRSNQVRLRFSTKEAAIAYCERHGIPYQVFEGKEPDRKPMAYADNFSYTRRGLWTH